LAGDRRKQGGGAAAAARRRPGHPGRAGPRRAGHPAGRPGGGPAARGLSAVGLLAGAGGWCRGAPSFSPRAPMGKHLFLPDRRLSLGATLPLGAMFFPTRGLFAEELFKTPRQTEGPFSPDKLPLDTDNDLLPVNDSIPPAVGKVTHLTGRV